jgi:hypothetical protein
MSVRTHYVTVKRQFTVMWVLEAHNYTHP